MGNDEIKTNDETPEASIRADIDLFVGHVESISDGFMVGMILAVQAIRATALKNLKDFEEQYCTFEEKDGKTVVSFRGENQEEWRRLNKRVRTITISLINLPRSMLVTLVSHFDSYVGRLIRSIYLKRPELLNASDRKLTFEELTRFDSIDTVREYIIEKEVEAVLRSSHIDQFRWMENKYDVPLTKGLESWPTFVELMERRNLFVHTDGVISSQYIAVCGQQGCILEEGAREGTKLGVPQQYFNQSTDCIYEIGVKLGHVLWRKQFPDDREAADKALIQTSYELLVSKRYKVAMRILDFACNTIKKYSSEVYELMLIVNRAIAYKASGEEKSAKHALKGIDWSAKGDEFKLANAVLLNNWEAASNLMKKIGNEGSVSKSDYRNWPLFYQWREREEFKKAYEEVFGEEFDAVIEVDVESEQMVDDVLPDGAPGKLDESSAE